MKSNDCSIIKKKNNSRDMKEFALVRAYISLEENQNMCLDL